MTMKVSLINQMYLELTSDIAHGQDFFRFSIRHWIAKEHFFKTCTMEAGLGAGALLMFCYSSKTGQSVRTH